MAHKETPELIVLLLDANASAIGAMPTTSPVNDDFEEAIEMIEDIWTQKIFSESRDFANLIMFGIERIDHGCEIVMPFQETSFKNFYELTDLQMSNKSPTTVHKGLDFATETIIEYREKNPRLICKSTIVLLSNLDSASPSMLTDMTVSFLAMRMREERINLFILSPEYVIKRGSPEKRYFVDEMMKFGRTKWMSFSEYKSYYAVPFPKGAGVRPVPFNLKLDHDKAIRLQMYQKNSRAKFDHKFTYSFEYQGDEMRKCFHYTTRSEQVALVKGKQGFVEGEGIPKERMCFDEDRYIVYENELNEVFYYGRTPLPIDQPLKAEFTPERLGRELNLIYFTAKTNILPQYLLSEPRYLLPVRGNNSSRAVMQGLIDVMLRSNLAAIVRYCYNDKHDCRIACLVPKIAKRGIPFFIHYILPYREDMRTYEFPPLDVPENQPDPYQKVVLNQFIDAFMLNNNEFRSKYTPSPRLQHEALKLRIKAMDPSYLIHKYIQMDKIFVNFGVRTTPEALAATKELGEAFKLKAVDSVRETYFGNEPLGVDPFVVERKKKKFIF